MCLTWPKRLVMIDCAYKGSDVCVILWAIHLEDAIDALLPRFDSFWCHPKSKEVSFFDKPLTLEGVALHVVDMESREDKVNYSKVIIK